jgi:sulfate permease, SulP family
MPKVTRLRRVPATLLVLIFATGVQAVFKFDGVATIGSAFGGIPRGLPSFAVPAISLSQMLLLIGPAFAFAMLGAIESLLSAVVADRMAGTRHSANQELVGQGLANMVVPFFGGFAATGAIARTATSIRNGGTSPLAGMVHVLTLVGVLLVLAPMAAHIPLASLSAILFLVAWNMSEPHQVKLILQHAPPADRVVLVVTFLLTVFVDLVVAVNAGVILAVLHFLRRMSQSVRMRTLADKDGTRVCQVEGPLFFAAVGLIEVTVRGLPDSVKHWVLDLSQSPFIDETAIQALEDAVRSLKHRGIKTTLVAANDLVLKKLTAHGTLTLLGEDGYASTLLAVKPVV